MLVLSQTKVMNNIFQFGQDHGEFAEMRIKKVMNEDCSTISNLVINQKDHKAPDAETILPKTHPVCEAAATHNQSISDLLTDIMMSTFHSETSKEGISTEDMLSKVD